MPNMHIKYYAFLKNYVSRNTWKYRCIIFFFPTSFEQHADFAFHPGTREKEKAESKSGGTPNDVYMY